MREVAQLVEQSFLPAASGKPGSYLFNGSDGLQVRVLSSRLNLASPRRYTQGDCASIPVFRNILGRGEMENRAEHLTRWKLPWLKTRQGKSMVVSAAMSKNPQS